MDRYPLIEPPKILSVHYDQSCCGIKQVVGYSVPCNCVNPECWARPKKRLPEIDNDLSLIIKQCNNNTLVSSLAEYQNSIYKFLMLKHGFKCVAKFRNPNSGNIVYYYVWCRNHPDTEVGDINGL